MDSLPEELLSIRKNVQNTCRILLALVSFFLLIAGVAGMLGAFWVKERIDDAVENSLEAKKGADLIKQYHEINSARMLREMQLQFAEEIARAHEACGHMDTQTQGTPND